MKNTTIVWTVIVLLIFGCFALLPTAQAVSPAPDGGYPGGNTAEGQSALLSLTTGGFNTAVGFLSLRSNTTGSFNTALGAGALLANTGGSGIAGAENTAIGTGALLNNTTGDLNTANGAFALVSNTTGVANSALGSGALAKNTTGSNNIAIGFDALFSHISNNNNIAIGSSALYNSSIGGGNIAIGNEAGLFVMAASDTICIGATGADVSGSCFIGSIRGVTTINNDAIPVLIDSNSQLGTVSSSRRYKTDIKPMDKASESILAVKPVIFRYKVHKDSTPQFGLIAEDVAEVNPDLVIYDADGKPYSVRYDAVNAMLLNEFLKEHRKVQELEANAARQQQQIEAVSAGLQKVTAQLELSKPAPKTVVNDN